MFGIKGQGGWGTCSTLTVSQSCKRENSSSIIPKGIVASWLERKATQRRIEARIFRSCSQPSNFVSTYLGAPKKRSISPSKSGLLVGGSRDQLLFCSLVPFVWTRTPFASAHWLLRWAKSSWWKPISTAWNPHYAPSLWPPHFYTQLQHSHRVCSPSHLRQWLWVVEVCCIHCSHIPLDLGNPLVIKT